MNHHLQRGKKGDSRTGSFIWVSSLRGHKSTDDRQNITFLVTQKSRILGDANFADL